MSESNIPWENIVSKTIWYTVYRETNEQGHILRYIYVIKDKNGSGLPAAVHSCYAVGATHQANRDWENYQIKILVGPNSGAEIDQLYVELQPVKQERYNSQQFRDASTRLIEQQFPLNVAEG